MPQYKSRGRTPHILTGTQWPDQPRHGAETLPSPKLPMTLISRRARVRFRDYWKRDGSRSPLDCFVSSVSMIGLTVQR